MHEIGGVGRKMGGDGKKALKKLRKCLRGREW